MTQPTRILVALGAATAVVAVVAVRAGRPDAPPAAAAAAMTTSARVPRLVDVGAGRCIPCKEMAPILEQLRVEYAGRMDVQFVDVWQDPRAAEPYRVRMIPTQIFYAADGRELFRHEGFMAKADILGRWKALGVEL